MILLLYLFSSHNDTKGLRYFEQIVGIIHRINYHTFVSIMGEYHYQLISLSPSNIPFLRSDSINFFIPVLKSIVGWNPSILVEFDIVIVGMCL